MSRFISDDEMADYRQQAAEARLERESFQRRALRRLTDDGYNNGPSPLRCETCGGREDVCDCCPEPCVQCGEIDNCDCEE